MGIWLSEREQRLVAGAEEASAETPIPTQIVSNGEYLPPRQSPTQKKVERRIVLSSPMRMPSGSASIAGSSCARVAAWRQPSSP